MTRLVLTIEEMQDDLILSGKTYKVVEIRKQNWLHKIMGFTTKKNEKTELKPGPVNLVIPGICVMPFIPTRAVQEELWAHRESVKEVENANAV